MKFSIENQYVNFGVFEASSEAEVLDKLAQAEGYSNLDEVMTEQPDLNFIVTIIE